MAAVEKREELHNIEQPSRKRKVVRKVVKRKVRKPRVRRSRLKSRAQLISSMVLVATVSLLLLSRYAEISRARYQLSDLDRQIYSASLERDELSVEMNQIKNSETLISQAHDKVNLRPAGQGQIVDVNVSSALNEAKRPKNSVIARVEGAIEKLFKN